MFIRVRSKGGPDAEYEIGAEEAAAHPDLYEVIDGSSHAASHATKATGPKTSVGDNSEENKS